MTVTIAERVAAGAEFLDKHEPGWAERIDVNRLDLASGCRCVLGQLETPLLQAHDDPDDAYSYAIERRDIPWFVASDKLGFNVPNHVVGSLEAAEEYEGLTAEWRRVIVERRAAS